MNKNIYVLFYWQHLCQPRMFVRRIAANRSVTKNSFALFKQSKTQQNVVLNNKMAVPFSKNNSKLAAEEKFEKIAMNSQTPKKSRAKLYFVLVVIGGSLVLLGSQFYEKPIREHREKLIVLGTGWAAISFLNDIDTSKFEGTVFC